MRHTNGTKAGRSPNYVADHIIRWYTPPIPVEGRPHVATFRVRYIVDDVDAALSFYTELLGFKVDMHPAPGFAAISRDGLQLLLNKPGGGGGAGQSMPDGQVPAPGG